jgi:hypothetical protein
MPVVKEAASFSEMDVAAFQQIFFKEETDGL